MLPLHGLHLHGYNASIISTIVDCGGLFSFLVLGYNASIISTIVDSFRGCFWAFGYNASIISTIVDINLARLQTYRL